MKLKYVNSHKIKGSFILNINTQKLLNKDLEKELSSRLDDPRLLEKLVKKYGGKLFLASGSETKNKFFVWFSKIKQCDNKNNVKIKSNIKSNKSNVDSENNNIIDFFDFSKKINKKFKLKIDFVYDSYETLLEIDSDKIQRYDKNSQLYKRYTKSEKYLEQTNEIKKLARKIVGKEKNYFEQARKIFHWILENLSYKYPLEKRGAIITLKNKCGDCGEFNHLFIALCRSLGIPARSVSGMWAIQKLKQGFHAWAEFYAENVGWIPVDSSVAQGLKIKDDKEFIKKIKSMKNSMNPDYYFGNLDNKRIIFSKGNNILLKNCPKILSQFEMMEECRSLFMQPTSIHPFVGGNKKGVFVVSINPELIVSP
jgi:hypothetical protein